MTRKRKPRWSYRAELFPRPYNFQESQIDEIKKVIFAVAKIPEDYFKEFITRVEDEIEAYKAYKVLEDEEPSIGEIRAAVSDIAAITHGMIDRLGAVDSSSRRIWSPHLDELLFKNIQGLTMSRDFYLRNDFRDNIEVTQHFLKNILDSLLVTLETVNAMPRAVGGKPPKEERRRFIRELAKHFKKYAQLPASTTDEGSFESVVRICLSAAGDPVEDVHKQIRLAFSDIP